MKDTRRQVVPSPCDGARPTCRDCRGAVSELIKAARAWDEYDGGQEETRGAEVQDRLISAYRRFTEPYEDDQFAEGVIVSEQTSEAVFPCSVEQGGGLLGSGEGNSRG